MHHALVNYDSSGDDEEDIDLAKASPRLPLAFQDLYQGLRHLPTRVVCLPRQLTREREMLQSITKVEYVRKRTQSENGRLISPYKCFLQGP